MLLFFFSHFKFVNTSSSHHRSFFPSSLSFSLPFSSSLNLIRFYTYIPFPSPPPPPSVLILPSVTSFLMSPTYTIVSLSLLLFTYSFLIRHPSRLLASHPVCHPFPNSPSPWQHYYLHPSTRGRLSFTTPHPVTLVLFTHAHPCSITPCGTPLPQPQGRRHPSVDTSHKSSSPKAVTGCYGRCMLRGLFLLNENWNYCLVYGVRRPSANS